MSSVSAGELLDAWERGRNAQPGERGLLLLAVAEPQLPESELAGWSVGRRDAALLALRERIFGPRLTGMSLCPRCAETLEVEFATADIAAPVPGDGANRMQVRLDDFAVDFRLPSAGDLAALGRVNGDQNAERWLLERCIVEVRQSGTRRAACELPRPVVDAVEAAMAAADPQAEVELALVCPACGGAWNTLFDIVSFLWRELDAWAARVLREVHTLAAAYGWSEREILALSAWRRGFYLELVGA